MLKVFGNNRIGYINLFLFLQAATVMTPGVDLSLVRVAEKQDKEAHGAGPTHRDSVLTIQIQFTVTDISIIVEEEQLSISFEARIKS